MTTMAVFDFIGETDELIHSYDELLDDVVAVSSARPLIHLAVPREYGLMVCDVWDTEDVCRRFLENSEFFAVLERHGMPEPRIRTFPVHNLGWPVSTMPLYR